MPKILTQVKQDIEAANFSEIFLSVGILEIIRERKKRLRSVI